MRIAAFLVLGGIAGLVSCAATKHSSPVPPPPPPRFAPGVRVLPQGGTPDSTATATLVVRLSDLRGAAMPHAVASLPELRIGLLTDEGGAGRFDHIPPGDWLVRWRVDGAVPPGIDSTRVHFAAGRAETLEVRIAMWHETRNDIADGKTPLPKRSRKSR